MGNRLWVERTDETQFDVAPLVIDLFGFAEVKCSTIRTTRHAESPMAVKIGRRSGRGRATTLRNEVEVGIELSVLGEEGDRRKRERIEARNSIVVGVGDDDVRARVAGLDMNNRVPCAKAHVGFVCLSKDVRERDGQGVPARYRRGPDPDASWHQPK